MMDIAAPRITLVAEALDPGFQAFVDAIAAAEARGLLPWDQLTPQEIRAVSATLRVIGPMPPGLVKRDLTIESGQVSLPARLYSPAGAPATGPGLVYYHGGGFTIGSIDSHDGITANLAAAAGVKVLSVDYRLAPEHKFPTAHDDALLAAKWAFDHAAEIGFEPGHIGIGGDSAGASLASFVCLELRADPVRRVKFQLLFYPNTTINDVPGSREVYANGYYLSLAAAHKFFDHYVDAAQAVDPRIDLLHRADLAGLPPTFFSVGHCDILFDECLNYVRNMRDAGVPVELVTYPGYIHGFYGFSQQVPDVLKAFATAGAALAAGLAG